MEGLAGGGFQRGPEPVEMVAVGWEALLDAILISFGSLLTPQGPAKGYLKIDQKHLWGLPKDHLCGIGGPPFWTSFLDLSL